MILKAVVPAAIEAGWLRTIVALRDDLERNCRSKGGCVLTDSENTSRTVLE